MCGAPGVAAAAVRKVGDRLVGYYTRTSAGAPPVSVQEMRAVLAARLPAYMVPEAFMELTEMPLGSTGKVGTVLKWAGAEGVLEGCLQGACRG